MNSRDGTAPEAATRADPILALDASGVLGPGDSRTHIRLPFDLPEGIERLELGFAFSPGFLEDEVRSRELAQAALRRYGARLPAGSRRLAGPLRNLLTLSLDDPSGFRGCAHRHRPELAVELSAASATPGFVAGPLPAGRWTAIVSVHLVLSPRCEYRLRALAR